MAVIVPSASNRSADKVHDNSDIKMYRQRNLYRILALVSVVCCAAAIYRHSRNDTAFELSMRMRGHGDSVPAAAASGDLHTTASRHASTPLKLSPDIVKALGKADSELAKIQPLLGNRDHEEVNGDVHSAAVHQIAKPTLPASAKPARVSPPPPPPESAADIAKERKEAELWHTEQAMKHELDAETEHKSGSLWQHTVDIVHKDDPNADLISKLRPHLFSKSSSNGEKKEEAIKRVQSRSNSMKSQLKAELDAKTQNDMGRMENQVVDMQKRALDQDTHDSKVAETAAAHKSMPLSDMKKMLKSQLDHSVDSVVKRAKQLQSFSSDTELEKRLKAELDAKTKAQEKKLLVSQRMKQSLTAARHKLHGRVDRAARVRIQLSKEMKEENAIRHQLDMQAERAGKRMLKQQLSPHHGAAAARAAAPHEATRADLEDELRRRLDSKDSQMLQSGAASQQARHGHAKGGEDPMEKVLREKLQRGGGGGKAAGGGDVHDLQNYLRKQLDATDQVKQRTLYRHTVQGHLLRHIAHGGTAADGTAPGTVAARNRAMHNAAMRLFRNSMRQAEGRPGHAASPAASPAAAAAQGPRAAADGTTAALLKQALHDARAGQGHVPFADLHKQEAEESRTRAARAAQVTDVPTAIEKVMEGTLQRARGVEPFAALHKAGGGAADDDGEVHDMAHASQHSTLEAAGLSKVDGLVLGHMRELRAADATADEIRRSRAKTVHEAQEEEQEAVE